VGIAISAVWRFECFGAAVGHNASDGEMAGGGIRMRSGLRNGIEMRIVPPRDSRWWPCVDEALVLDAMRRRPDRVLAR